MNRGIRMVAMPLALLAVLSAGAGYAAQPGKTEQPWGPATAAKPGGHGNGGGHWDEHFQGRGNVTNTRCLGMSRGPDCITAESRKEAARRLQAQLAAADGGATAPDTGTAGRGGHQK